MSCGCNQKVSSCGDNNVQGFISGHSQTSEDGSGILAVVVIASLLWFFMK